MASLQAAKLKAKPSPEAIWQFQKPKTFFGLFDNLIKPTHGGIFDRYGSYFTWSRWDKVLFLPRVPQRGRISDYHRLRSLGSGDNDAVSVSTNYPERRRNFMNFDPNSASSSSYQFMMIVFSVLTCQTLAHSIRVQLFGIDKKSTAGVAVQAFDYFRDSSSDIRLGLAPARRTQTLC